MKKMLSRKSLNLIKNARNDGLTAPKVIHYDTISLLKSEMIKNLVSWSMLLRLKDSGRKNFASILNRMIPSSI